MDTDRIANAGGFRGLALDLDGTLLEGEAGLAACVRHGVQALRDGGVRVCLLSGRMHPSVIPVWHELGLDTPIASYNGARIGLPGEPPLRETWLPAEVAPAVEAACAASGFHVNLYAGDRLYVRRENEVSAWYSRFFGIPVTQLGPGRDLPAPLTKMLAIVAEGRLNDAEAVIRAAIGASAFVTTSSRRFVEVLPHGADKGSALRYLAGLLAIPPGAWVAAGDGRNDLEMIQAAGLGVAVSSAEDALKREADLVVDPLWRGGLAQLVAAAWPPAPGPACGL